MIKAKAYAKFNLNLHILPDINYKKRTGYYPIHCINCELDLHDELYFEKQKNVIDFICDNKDLSNKQNLVYKTAILLKNTVKNDTLGAKITLKKNIPVKAGLGGGSSDAAVTLYNLIKLWKLKLSCNQIQSLNKQIGSDTAYCYKGGVCEVTGQGSENTCVYLKNNKCIFHQKQCFAVHNCDKVCKLSRVPCLWVVLIVPEKQKRSTAWMYANLDITTIGKHVSLSDKLKQALNHKDRKGIIKSMFNDFEHMVRDKNDEVFELQTQLDKMKADRVFIAGSGLTVVGLFISRKESLKVFHQLKKMYNHVIWTRTK